MAESMAPLDIAAKFSSAHNHCKGNRCPYVTGCTGKPDTCKLRDVAMVLRAQEAEIDSLKITVAGLRDIILMLQRYAAEQEEINIRYRNLVQAFQHGYKPKRKLSHVKYKRPVKPRKKIPVEQMDGDERYAQPDPPKNPPEDPMVVI